jgi:hypothetical protein
VAASAEPGHECDSQNNAGGACEERVRGNIHIFMITRGRQGPNANAAEI